VTHKLHKLTHKLSLEKYQFRLTHKSAAMGMLSPHFAVAAFRRLYRLRDDREGVFPCGKFRLVPPMPSINYKNHIARLLMSNDQIAVSLYHR
jgi:hypothetical protein